MPHAVCFDPAQAMSLGADNSKIATGADGALHSCNECTRSSQLCEGLYRVSGASVRQVRKLLPELRGLNITYQEKSKHQSTKGRGPARKSRTTSQIKTTSTIERCYLGSRTNISLVHELHMMELEQVEAWLEFEGHPLVTQGTDATRQRACNQWSWAKT